MASDEPLSMPSVEDSQRTEFSALGDSTQQPHDELPALPGSRSLKQAYINEKSAPEVLPYVEELVSFTQERIAKQEDCLDEWDCDREQDVVAGIMRTEVQRERYLLCGYLRTRLRKIEKHVMSILDDDEEVAKLSPQEKRYALQFFRQFGSYITTQLLDHLPHNFESMAKESVESPTKDMVDHPDLEQHVFFQVIEDCPLTDVGITSVAFQRGDQYTTSYKYIRQLLLEEFVNLR